MKSYLMYKKSSGAVVSQRLTRPSMIDVYLSEDSTLGAVEGEIVSEEVWIDTSVDPVEIKQKVANPCYLDGETIKSVPNPSSVLLQDGVSDWVTVVDGEVVLDADIPGEYNVVVRPEDPKYYQAKFKVTL